MAQQTINVGTAPNDGTGTPLRTAFQYTNSNFSELYTAVGPSGNNIVVPGNATITGDLTVDTNTLKVDSANNRVGIQITSPTAPLEVGETSGTALRLRRLTSGNTIDVNFYNTNTTVGDVAGIRCDGDGLANAFGAISFWTTQTPNSLVERYRISSVGVHTWQNVGGVAGTAMTLNSTGLGVGGSPTEKLSVNGSLGLQNGGTQRWHISATSGSDLIFTRSTVADRFTITSDGNVGIGVTPSAWAANRRALQVGGLASAALALNGTSNVSEMFFNSFINTSASNVYAVNGRAGLIDFGSGGFGFSIDSGTQTAGAACNFTRAMTLDASGNLLVGTTGVGGVFDTKFYLSSNSGTNKWAVGPYSTATNFAIIPTPGTGGVYLSGTSATSWTAYSDERLKDIIEPITNALTKIGSLRSVIGKFKGDETNTRRPFLIAQDLQSALPEAVDASNPDRLGVAYTDVIPLLVAAIKELTAEVNALKNA